MPARATPDESSAELSELRSRLAEAEETLRAIRCGEVDALVTDGENGPQVFTLEGADHAYRVLIESMNEGALTLTADMMVLYANKCFAKMVKSPLEKVMGGSFGRFLSTDDLAALIRLMQQPGESGSKVQVLLNAGDGTCLPVQISIRPLPANRSKAAITMVVADMTQARHIEELLRTRSRRAEAALGKSEAKLAMAFASMTEAISIADTSGRLTDFNDEFVRYHRFKNRDECRRTMADCPTYLEAYFADGTPAPPEQWAMARALRGETASSVEYRMCRKETGETWWGSYSFGPVHDKGGRFAGAVVSCRDVTERKEAEEALRHNERRFRGIFDSALQFIGLLTPDGTVLEANRTALEAGGLRGENVIGKPFWECDWWTLTERTVRELQTAIRRAASGEVVRYDVDVRGAEGQILTIDFSIKPIRDEAGRVVLLIPEGRDITCLKRAEENLRLTNQRFAFAVKCSQVILWQQDLELRYIWLYNPAPGIDGSDAGGKKDEDLLERAEDAAVIVALKSEVIRSGVGMREEFSPQIQGVVHCFDVLLEPLRDASGRITGITGAAIDITERKRMEESLRASESFNQAVIDSIPAHLAVLDADGTVVTVNAPWRTFAEKNGAQSDCCGPGTNYLDVCHAAAAKGSFGAAEVARGVQAVLNRREASYSHEYECHSPDEQRWFVMQVLPASEPLKGAIVTHWSVTEQRLAEAARHKIEQNYRALATASSEVMYRMSADWATMLPLDGRELFANSDVSLTDWSWMHSYLPPDEHPRVRQAIRKAIAGKTLFELEHRVLRPDGSTGWTLSRAVPIIDENKEVLAWFGAASDITERKWAEEAMLQSKAKMREQLVRMALLEQITRAINNHLDFQHILKSVTDHLEDHLPVDFCCVCLFDEQAGNYEVAQVGTKSTPLAMEMAMPEHAVISLDCDALAQVSLGKLRYLPDVREMAFPFPRRLANGGLGSLILAPLQLEGNVFGFLLVARRAAQSFADGECDFLRQLSEHVALSCRQARLHNALQTAHDDLRRTQQTTMQRERLRALGQMACGITHDISNAISPVTLYTASLLEHEKNLSVRARDSLQTIHQSVQNVAETITRMREFCRQGEAQVVLTPIHLNHVAQQALDLTRVHWSDSPHERGIVIQTEIRLVEDLPDIMGVESEIRDAIVNLILNAVDAMPEGGTLTLRTVTKLIAPGSGGTPNARQACLELIDTGIGMDEDTRRRCLEPFFTTKGEHGSGMGLAMVYGMISRHRAEINIESTPGQGTTVRMIFPVIKSASRAVDQPLPAKLDPVNQRILFIDDDPLLIKSMRDTLEADGHTVVTAAGGQEGIDVFIHAQERNEAFTVVITDLGMPHVDGRKVARAVKAASPSTPVILLTGWGQRVEAEDDLLAQVDRLLCKPPNLRELREALAAAVH